jgi:hypothetical protein
MNDEDLAGIFGMPEERVNPYPIHTLVVEAVEDLDGLVETDQYTLDHGTCELRGDECLVESTVRELGLRGAINGVWSKDPVELRTYRVRGWVTKYDIPGAPIEYDAGIEEVGDDEAS